VFRTSYNLALAQWSAHTFQKVQFHSLHRLVNRLRNSTATLVAITAATKAAISPLFALQTMDPSVPISSPEGAHGNPIMASSSSAGVFIPTDPSDRATFQSLPNELKVNILSNLLTPKSADTKHLDLETSNEFLRWKRMYQLEHWGTPDRQGDVCYCRNHPP
jgi:hypothetical protein